MTKSPEPADDASEGPLGSHFPDEQLPRVSPPSAGFLIQLFLIPMLIVGIIVLVWLMFSWLAHLGTRPEELAADLEKLNAGSWQKALTLAHMLRDPGNDQLRHDAVLAARLSSALESQLEQGSDGQDQVWLRMWLSRALGQFEIDAVVPALVKATVVEHSPADIDVRRAALQAIGLLADRLGGERLRDQPGLLAALKQAAQDSSDDPAEEQKRGQLRAAAACAVGIVGGEEAIEQVVRTLGDPYPDARYNAATGLARHGDARAMPRLLEMLRANNAEAVAFEEGAERVWKQSLVWENGLRASRELVRQNAHAKREQLAAAVRRLGEINLPAAVRVERVETLRILEGER
jgi:hypothetical protein